MLSLHVGLLKPVLTFIALLCGASVGREGPTVQIGAAIANFVGRHNSTRVRRSLILAGDAAGVAAAFNTPIAGIVFAIATLASNRAEKTSGTLSLPVILAALAAIDVPGARFHFVICYTPTDHF